MKRIIIICIALLILTLIGDAQNLDYTTKPEIVPAVVTTPNPPVQDVEILDFVRSCSVQVQVRVKRLKRTINWYKLIY